MIEFCEEIDCYGKQTKIHYFADHSIYIRFYGFSCTSNNWFRSYLSTGVCLEITYLPSLFTMGSLIIRIGSTVRVSGVSFAFGRLANLDTWHEAPPLLWTLWWVVTVEPTLRCLLVAFVPPTPSHKKATSSWGGTRMLDLHGLK